jgi:hypothetical protein
MHSGMQAVMQLLQSCVFEGAGVYPGLPKPNPGLKLANAFSVICDST